ncbi:MAG: hypothetical protein HY964_08920 [Ignavibacteriales bacterium]|nr:hypothetical protein [Ignavibacteriales bacterium]
MQNLSSAAEYVRQVEEFAGKKFKYFEEIYRLVETADKKNLNSKLDDLLFVAKFIVKANNILIRVGPGQQDTEKMTVEYALNLNKAVLIIDEIAGDSIASLNRMVDDLRGLNSGDRLDSFINFMYELSWLKNYTLDRKGERLDENS